MDSDRSFDKDDGDDESEFLIVRISRELRIDR